MFDHHLLLGCSADALLSQIRDALSKVDVIVTSGGVSMGEKVHSSLGQTYNE